MLDFVAQAGGAPQHLVEQDAAVHAPQKDQVADLGHVHAGGQQVHGHGHGGEALVLIAADQLQRFIGCAGDLDDGIVFHAAVLLTESLFEQVYHHVGVGILDTENERLLARKRVDLARQVLAHHLVERLWS